MLTKVVEFGFAPPDCIYLKDGITCCIQVSAKVAIGVPINPASSFNNPQYDITILAWKASYIIRAMYRSINYTDCSRNICRGAKS
ncbi:hypothetical protein SUGI_0812380 [Cryptomeria japonica]|nr:hypothetical protein SUGI_0812380 [Cryptomeria japonica]